MTAEPEPQLHYTYSGLVRGSAFAADVTLDGVAAREYEDGAFIVSGVEPAGLAAAGETPDEAESAFLKMLRDVIADVAHECRTFDEFELALRKFVRETSGRPLSVRQCG